MKCKDCRYYDTTGTGMGLCRRHPPIEQRTMLSPGFAVVNGENDWCGEYSDCETQKEQPAARQQPTANKKHK